MVTIVQFVANCFTIVASGIVIYLFFTKGKTVGSVFRLLLNYSFQTTLSELNGKLDRLGSLNVNEPSHRDEITNLFNEIAGQIKGNRTLKKECPGILRKLTAGTKNTAKVTEPEKRSTVSELREILRHINIEKFDDLIGRVKWAK